MYLKVDQIYELHCSKMLCRYSSKVSMVKKVNRKEPGVPKSDYTKKKLIDKADEMTHNFVHILGKTMEIIERKQQTAMAEVLLPEYTQEIQDVEFGARK